MSTINSDYYLNESNTVNAKRAIQGKGADQLTMDDFFNLFAAQMTNQDMMNPQDNTEFVAQMAQFTSLQGIKQIQEYQLSSYAVSYVGKDVSIAEINEYTGDLETITGKVEGVTFYDGTPQVVVNGKTYPLYKIMEVTAQGSTSSSNSALGEWSGYVGKYVRILHENEIGIPETINGKVERVTLVDGKPYVVVNGTEYPASEVQAILNDEDGAFIVESEYMSSQFMNKNVTIRHTDEDGNEVTFSGKVTEVVYYGGDGFYVTLEGDSSKRYPVRDVIEIEG